MKKRCEWKKVCGKDQQPKKKKKTCGLFGIRLFLLMEKVLIHLWMIMGWNMFRTTWSSMYIDQWRAANASLPAFNSTKKASKSFSTSVWRVCTHFVSCPVTICKHMLSPCRMDLRLEVFLLMLVYTSKHTLPLSSCR